MCPLLENQTLKTNCDYWQIYDSTFKEHLDLNKIGVPKQKNACPEDVLDYSEAMTLLQSLCKPAI